MPNFERAEKWLNIARRDLKTAKALIDLPEPDFHFASFACQQVAEKSIKAFLAFHDKKILKTHYIKRLIFSASEIDPDLHTLLSPADKLTPYAIASRYPSLGIEINTKTTAAAVTIATETYNSILKNIKKD